MCYKLAVENHGGGGYWTIIEPVGLSPGVELDSWLSSHRTNNTNWSMEEGTKGFADVSRRQLVPGQQNPDGIGSQGAWVEKETVLEIVGHDGRSVDNS